MLKKYNVKILQMMCHNVTCMWISDHVVPCASLQTGTVEHHARVQTSDHEPTVGVVIRTHRHISVHVIIVNQTVNEPILVLK